MIEKNLKKILELVSELGSINEALITLTIRGINIELTKAEIEEAKRLKKEASKYKAKGERLCLRTLLRYQPVAKDLHLVYSSIQAFYDLDRISTQAINILDLIHRPDTRFMLQSLHTEKMAQYSKLMLDKSIAAFVQNNYQLAQEVVTLDDRVDQYFLENQEQLETMIKKHTDKAKAILDTILVIKYYEKMSDHAVNIVLLVKQV